MAEVYLAAGAVTYSRVAAQLDIEVLPGGWCFIAAVLSLTMAEAALDKRRIWSALYPDTPSPPPGQPVLSCLSCQLVLPAAREGEDCPRCARRLRVRRRTSLERTVALTVAALILLYPAFFLPMIVTVQPNGVFEHTVFDGVAELFGRGFWYLGAIVFGFSIAVPGLKLVTLLWMVLSVRFPHRALLRFRARLHRFVDEINHWSFIDPFIVALNAAMLSYPGVVSVSPAPGALAFSLVVVLTMIASRMFDARLMWDAVEDRR
jgi:paraquat-inducible protein A